MSVKKPQLFFLFILSIGFLAFYALKTKPMLRRSFASENINISQFSSRGVVDRKIQLKFETKGTEVVAIVSLPFDYDEYLQYKWTLGENVSLIEGAIQGKTEKGFYKNQIQKIRIKVRDFTPDNLRHIGFEIWGQQNNQRLFADGLISSQIENSFERIVQQIEKSKAEKSGESK